MERSPLVTGGLENKSFKPQAPFVLSKTKVGNPKGEVAEVQGGFVTVPTSEGSCHIYTIRSDNSVLYFNNIQECSPV